MLKQVVFVSLVVGLAQWTASPLTAVAAQGQLTIAKKSEDKNKKPKKKEPAKPACNTCSCVVISGPVKCTDTPTGPRIEIGR